MRHPEVPEDDPREVRGPRERSDAPVLQGARGHRHRAPAGPRFRRRQASSSTAGFATTGDTTASPSSRPSRDTARSTSPGEGVREFKEMVKRLHAAGIEVILDVVYNHTAEGNHLGPYALVQGDRQPHVLPARRRRPALLFRLHRHRQQPQRPPPADAPAHHGFAAVLGDRDARRRVSLRPRVDARAVAPRGRPALELLHDHPPGPGHQPGEAHRRAVGRRRGRLPGRQLSGALGGVERASTATSMRALLEGRRRARRRARRTA